MKAHILEIIDRIKVEEDIIQKARLIYYLRKNQDIRLKEVADALGESSVQVAHILRLLKLPHLVIDGYYAKVVSMTHLFIIARLKTQEDMIEAYESILSHSLSVQQTEELVREKLYNIRSLPDRLTETEIQQFITALKEIDPALDIKVTQTRLKASVAISLSGDTAYTTEVFNKLLKQFKGELPVVNKKEMVHPLE